MNIDRIQLRAIGVVPISSAYDPEDVGTALSILFRFWSVYQSRADEVIIGGVLHEIKG